MDIFQSVVEILLMRGYKVRGHANIKKMNYVTSFIPDLFAVEIPEVEEKFSPGTNKSKSSLGDIKETEQSTHSSSQHNEIELEELKNQVKDLNEKLDAEYAKSLLLQSQLDKERIHLIDQEKDGIGKSQENMRLSLKNKRDNLQLADKIRETLRQRERIEHLEVQLSKTKQESENMHDAFKKLSESSQAAEEKATEKIKFLTEKFTSYLKENTSLQSSVQDTEMKNKTLESKLDRVMKENDHLKIKLTDLEKELSNFRNEGQPKDLQLVKGVSIDELMVKNAELESSRVGLIKEIEYFKSELARSTQEAKVKELEQKCVALLEENHDLQSRLGAIREENDLLHAEFDSLEKENLELKKDQSFQEQSIKQTNDDITKITQEKNALLHEVNHYRIEFQYLQDLLKNNPTTALSPISGKYEENTDEVSKFDIELQKKMLQKPKEDLKAIHDYMSKLDELEKQISALQNEFDKKNSQLADLALQQKSECNVSETAENRILQVYKKIVEIKNAENQDLRSRVKEKSAIINLNVEIIEKLETTVQEKIDEITEATQFKERLLQENDRLTKLVAEKNQEVERVYSDHKRTKKDLEGLRKKVTSSKSTEHLNDLTHTPNKTDPKSDDSNSVPSQSDYSKYLEMGVRVAEEYQKNFESNLNVHYSQTLKKLEKLESHTQSILLLKEMYKKAFSSLQILRIKYDDQKNFAEHYQKQISETQAKGERELRNQKVFFEKIINELKQEILKMKQGMISDIQLPQHFQMYNV